MGIGAINAADLAMLDEAEFDAVWTALGTVVGKIARARMRARAPASMGERDESEEAIDDA